MYTNRGRIRYWLAATCVALAGCGAAGGDSAPIEITGPPPMFAQDAPVQNTGPNGGRLIELGRNRKYRAELVVDMTAAEVRLHVFDRDLRAIRVVDQQAILNIFVEGGARSFELAPRPRVNPAAESLAQAFSTHDQELIVLLGSGGARTCKVRLFIDDKAYTGLLAYNAETDDGLARDVGRPVEQLKR